MIKRLEHLTQEGIMREREGAVQSGQEKAWWDFTHVY